MQTYDFKFIYFFSEDLLFFFISLEKFLFVVHSFICLGKKYYILNSLEYKKNKFFFVGFLGI